MEFEGRETLKPEIACRVVPESIGLPDIAAHRFKSRVACLFHYFRDWSPSCIGSGANLSVPRNRLIVLTSTMAAREIAAKSLIYGAAAQD